MTTTPRNSTRINIDPDQSSFCLTTVRSLVNTKIPFTAKTGGADRCSRDIRRKTNPNPFSVSGENIIGGGRWWSISRVPPKRARFGQGPGVSDGPLLGAGCACPTCIHTYRPTRARKIRGTMDESVACTRVQLSKHSHERNIRGIALSLRVCPLLR